MDPILSMIAGEGQHAFDPLGAFDAGRQVAFDNKIRKRKLADLQLQDDSRIAMGGALMGDEGSRSRLATLDPNGYMDVGKYEMGQQKQQMEVDDAQRQQILDALVAADTPEKWDRTINVLEARGLPVDPEERDFANRDALLSQAIGGKEYANNQIAQQNADTARMNAEGGGSADANDEMATRRAQAEQVGLDPASIEYQTFVLTGKLPMGRSTKSAGAAGGGGTRRKLTATEQKELWRAEDENSVLDNSLSTLDEADRLLAPVADGSTVGDPSKSNVLDGYGAGLRGDLAAKAPGIASRIPFVGATPEQGLATSEFGKIMSMEAIKSMSELLKGATTDKEMREFVDNLADPSVPNEIKRRTLARMKLLLKRKRDTNAGRMKQLAPDEQPAPQDAPQQYPGADGVTPADQGGGFDNSGGGITEDQLPEIMNDAARAIENGADPEAVIQRMIETGIDEQYARSLLNG